MPEHEVSFLNRKGCDLTMRDVGADRVSSFGDFIAMSAPCDLATAKIISGEVSDGVIAPGHAPEALDVLKKKAGKYCVLEVISPLHLHPLEKLTRGGSVTTRGPRAPVQERRQARRKANAIDLFVNEEGSEKAQWEAQFETVPAALSEEERKAWAAKLDGVACSSDALFPFADNPHPARKSVRYLAAPSGSMMDVECTPRNASY